MDTIVRKILIGADIVILKKDKTTSSWGYGEAQGSGLYMEPWNEESRTGYGDRCTGFTNNQEQLDIDILFSHELLSVRDDLMPDALNRPRYLTWIL